MNYKGSCHCGELRFEVEGKLEQVIECNCSHCSRKGYLLWFLPRASLTLQGTTNSMSTYTFNRHLIAHQFCPRCGCAPFGFGAGRDGAASAAINVRCLEGVELTELKRVPFDGRAN
jgi:hypothetical protein